MYHSRSHKHSLVNCVFWTYKVGQKRKRALDPDAVSQGAARAHRFLKEFAELPLEQMDLKQALQHVNKMKNDLEKDAENCHWLKQFL